MSEPALVYHNEFGDQFSGATAREIVEKMSEEYRARVGINLQQWWEYQRSIDPTIAEMVPADANAAGASEWMLNALVAQEALNIGPMPPGRGGTGQSTKGYAR